MKYLFLRNILKRFESINNRNSSLSLYDAFLNFDKLHDYINAYRYLNMIEH